VDEVAELARDATPGLDRLFRDMAASFAALGAPTYADLAQCVVEWSDVEPLLSLLAPYEDARVGDMVPLRLLGAAHRLVLQRHAPELAMYFATAGGTPPQSAADREGCRRAFLATLDRHRQQVSIALEAIPQTNEVARTEGLAALLRRVGAAFGLPVRLHEIGCSAGLSLRVDELASVGVVASQREDWGPMPSLVERVGCDLAPVDALSMEGRLHLTSFVWPDHVERFERLRAALHVAERVPVDVIAEDAVEHVRALALVPGTTLVVWHSAMWLYLPRDARAEIRDALQRLGEGAGPTSPLVHVALEPFSEGARSQHRFRLDMATWPGVGGIPAGFHIPWATTPPSGVPVTWNIPCAAGIVTNPVGDLLLVRRGRSPALGLWSLPGGRVEDGESWDAAALREVEEETGIRAEIGGFAGVVERDSGSATTYVIADFRMTGDGTPRPGDDAADARWFRPDDVLGLTTSPGLVEALRGWGDLRDPTAS
jgi:ADP-ribose pyrophosphatase YjhB (NUDIX family)